MGSQNAGFWKRSWVLCVRFLLLVLEIVDESSSRGNLDLPAMFPIFGSMELEVLSVLSAFFIVFTHIITAWCAKEQAQVASCVISIDPVRFRVEARKSGRKLRVLRRRAFGTSYKISGTICLRCRKQLNPLYVNIRSELSTPIDAQSLVHDSIFASTPSTKQVSCPQLFLVHG